MVSEKIIFIVAMCIYFLMSISLIIKPDILYKMFFGFLKLFGFNANYSNKSIIIGRILGVLLVIWGIFVIKMSNS